MELPVTARGYAATRISSDARREARAHGCAATQACGPRAYDQATSARGVLYEEGMPGDAKTLELLQLLGNAWIVTLTCTCDLQWQLCLQSGPSWDEHFAYTYRGTLVSVVARAYAGEPADGPAGAAS